MILYVIQMDKTSEKQYKHDYTFCGAMRSLWLTLIATSEFGYVTFHFDKKSLFRW